MSIAERYKDIADRLRKHDAARKLIEGELLALQHECEHLNAKSIGGKDIDGTYSSTWSCPDCHKVKYT